MADHGKTWRLLEIAAGVEGDRVLEEMMCAVITVWRVIAHVCVVSVLATVLLPACAWSVIRVSMCSGRFDPLAFAWAGVRSRAEPSGARPASSRAPPGASW